MIGYSQTKLCNTSSKIPLKVGMTIRLLIALVFDALLIGALAAQPKTPEEFGLKHFELDDRQLGKLNFYVPENKLNEEKPMLVFLDGSGHLPMFYLIKMPDGRTQLGSKITIDFDALSEEFHVVLISKPGTPFLDSLEATSSRDFRRRYPASEEYTQQLSLDWRVNSASKIIDYLLEELPIAKQEVVVMGYSEGGQVVPKLAVTNSNITKVVSIVGSGLNQFYDMITDERSKTSKGLISAEEAQTTIDSLFVVFEDIYANPTSIDKTWWGHTYKRWASFCQDVPLENLIQLDIPILLIASGKDKNAPIAGIDYVQLEFLRQQKSNLNYKVYPNCDHYFYDLSTEQDRLEEVLAFVVDWVGG